MAEGIKPPGHEVIRRITDRNQLERDYTNAAFT